MYLKFKSDKEKTIIQKILKYREYQPPVIHLEFLSDKEIDIAWQIVNAFEESGVAFACVLKNEDKNKELNIHTYGIMTELEKQRIYNEVCNLYELNGYSFILN